MKNDFPFIKEQIEELITYPPFIKTVKDTRKKWNIPTNGFDITRENKDYKDWNYRFRKNDPTSPLTEGNAHLYAGDLSKIMKKFNLHVRWNTFLDFYVKYNIKMIPDSISIEFGKNEKTKERELKIMIGPHTRLKDIKKNWEEIKHYQKKLKGYIGSSRKKDPLNKERNKFIEKLDNQGYSHREIAEKVYDRFGIEENFPEDKSNITESGVSKVLLRRNRFQDTK